MSVQAGGSRGGGLGGARRFRRATLGAALVGAVALTLLATAAPADADPGIGLLSPDPATPVGLSAPAVIVTPGQDVPDPFVVRSGGTYYMFASQEQFFGPNVPVMASGSLASWPSVAIDAMPTLPRWAGPGFTWSPDVREIDGRYVMWFNAALAAFGFGTIKCIGVATATQVMGPYVSTATKPQVCQLDHLGSIDPRTFLDPQGRLWLLWKSDDNAAVNGTSHSTIFIQRLSPDGLSLLGRPIALMTADMPWEGRIVEAPDMVYAGGRYWLFFSGNWFNQPAYGIGVAACDSPTGPCAPATVGPWLSSNTQGAGPGEASLFYDGSRWWILYAPFAVDYQSSTPRPVALARLTFGPDGPTVVPPDTSAWLDPPPAAAPWRGPPCLSSQSPSSCAAWLRHQTDRR